mgnify:CR=1 FL=1
MTREKERKDESKWKDMILKYLLMLTSCVRTKSFFGKLNMNRIE